jgi:hypothetical protein
MSTKFKVWHIPQVPMKAFEFETEDLKTAVVVMEQLAFYDLFQFENKAKGDYSNASGISEWIEEEQEWWDIDDFDLEERLAEEAAA